MLLPDISDCRKQITSSWAQNGKLQNELAVLRNTLARYQAEDSLSRISVPAVTGDTTNMIIARVINNSIARKNNYITIDKGNRDGVFPEMGLVDQNGVVGVVSSASSGYAVALSLLTQFAASAARLKIRIISARWCGTEKMPIMQAWRNYPSI